MVCHRTSGWTTKKQQRFLDIYYNYHKTAIGKSLLQRIARGRARDAQRKLTVLINLNETSTHWDD